MASGSSSVVRPDCDDSQHHDANETQHAHGTEFRDRCLKPPSHPSATTRPITRLEAYCSGKLECATTRRTCYRLTHPTTPSTHGTRRSFVLNDRLRHVHQMARTGCSSPGGARSEARGGYSLRNASIASKNWIRGFSNSTKCVAFGMSTLFLTGACTRSRINPSRSSGKDQVSYAPAMTSVGT